jgi:hypothetical protein
VTANQTADIIASINRIEAKLDAIDDRVATILDWLWDDEETDAELAMLAPKQLAAFVTMIRKAAHEQRAIRETSR